MFKKKILLIDCPYYKVNLIDHAHTILNLNKTLQNIIRWTYLDNYFEGKIPFSRALLTLGNILKRGNFQVLYFNLIKHNLSEILDIMDADYIFMSALTPNVKMIAEICKSIKTINSSTQIIIGGYHVDYLGEIFLKTYSQIDYIVQSEVEFFANQMLLFGEVQNSFEGILYRNDNGTVIVNKIESSSKLVLDLEIPDYSLLDEINSYQINVSTMRGCIGRCSFCINGYRWGNPRFTSIERVKEELLWLKDHLKPNSIIYLTDNVFTIDRERVLEICQFIQKNKIQFRFSCDIKAGYVDIELIEQMEKSGFFQIGIGFEEANNEILKLNRKETTFEENVQSAKLVKEHSSMMVFAYWVTGLPGSTYESLAQNVLSIGNLLKEDIVDIVSPRMFVPYPGTPIYLKQDKYKLQIYDYDWHNYDRTGQLPVYYLEDLSEYDLRSYFIYLTSIINQQYIVKLKLSKNYVNKLISHL